MSPFLAWSAGSGLIDALGTAILHSLWQVTLVAAATALTLATMKRATAAARYAVACASLVLSLALPTATVLVPATSHTREPLAPLAVLNPLPAIQHDVTSAVGALPPAFSRGTFDGAFPWLVAAWATGVMLMSLRLVGGWLAVARLTRRAVRQPRPEWRESFDRLRARMRMSRGVRLLESAAVSVPTAIGWIRPVVLLPAAALAGLTPRQLDAIIAHELAHVRRYDYLVNLFQVGIETLLFYHPAAWWLSNRIRAEREHCCDDAAVELVGDALGYARALTRLEEQRENAAVLALAVTGGTLMNRIKRLRPAGATRTAWPLPLAILLALVAAAAVGAVATAAYAPTRTGSVSPSMAQPTPSTDTREVARQQDTVDDIGNQARELWVRVRRHVNGLVAGQTSPQATPKPTPAPKPTPTPTPKPEVDAPSGGSSSHAYVDFDSVYADIDNALRQAEQQYGRAMGESRRALTPEQEAQVRRALEEARRQMRDLMRHRTDYERLLRDYQRQVGEYARTQARQAVEAHRSEIEQAIREYQRQLRDYTRQMRDFTRNAESGQSPPTPPVPPVAPTPVPQIAPPAPPVPPVPPRAAPPAPRDRRNQAPPAPPAPAAPPPTLAPPAVPPPAAAAPPSAPAPPAPPSGSLLWRSGEHSETHIRQTDEGRTLEVQARGKVETTDDDTDIRSLSTGGYIIISDSTAGRTVTFEARNANGKIERKWTGLTGEAERRSWLAAHLAELRRR